MRVFAALPLPAAVVDRLNSLRLRLSEARDGLRWSTPEQWHITLKFYGESDLATLRCLENGLERLVAKPPQLSLASLGIFAAKGILYADVAGTPSLEVFQRKIQEVSVACGFAAESRRFQPHITLARSKGKAGLRTLQQLASPQLPGFGAPLHWSAEECLLLESTLQPTGAVYRVLRRIALREASADAAAGVF